VDIRPFLERSAEINLLTLENLSRLLTARKLS
jgi:hypothetical protein